MSSGPSRPIFAVGVDTGGTFTDLWGIGPDGGVRTAKVLSTPHDPSIAIAEAIERVRRSGEVVELVHGTTVATNALLERKGATVALITTQGFEDLLFLRRQHRPDLYSLHVTLPPAVVVPDHCVGVTERIGPDGSVVCDLDEDEIERVVTAVAGLDVDAAAICLLHSYANPEHERRLSAALRAALPGLHVTSSAELVGEFREYERASTAAVNAFVGPVMASYLDALQRRLGTERIEVLQSSGGRADLENAAANPVHTVLSGPAGGVLGAVAAARAVGLDRVITFDMGGTSTDVSLCAGRPALAHSAEIDGLPIRVPVLDILTVGAGGGSLAYVDEGGALKVGPQSSGAVPGPACYGRGGVVPTVTDAHLVLGRLRSDGFLGGAMALDVAAAERTVSELGARLGLSVRDTARGILDVADASMVRAMKVISVQRGHDPREFALVCFGGAGGLHGCRLASALGMTRVVVPADAGLLSAVGMNEAPPQRVFARTVLAPLSDAVLSGASRALHVAALEGHAGASYDAEVTVDLRYRGQSFEIDLRWEPDEPAEALTERFAQRHGALYGYRDDERSVELVAVRLIATKRTEPAPPRRAESTAGRDVAHVATVGFAMGDFEARVVSRAMLGADALPGPAVILEPTATTVVPPGWSARAVAGHLVLEADS